MFVCHDSFGIAGATRTGPYPGPPHPGEDALVLPRRATAVHYGTPFEDAVAARFAYCPHSQCQGNWVQVTESARACSSSLKKQELGNTSVPFGR